MGAGKVKQAKHSEAYNFCCISTTAKTKFKEERVTFCTLFVQGCVTETEPIFHILRGFMILLVIAVCPASAPWELRLCDGLKSCSSLRITLIVAALAFCQSFFAMA